MTLPSHLPEHQPYSQEASNVLREVHPATRFRTPTARAPAVTVLVIRAYIPRMRCLVSSPRQTRFPDGSSAGVFVALAIRAGFSAG